MRLRPAVIFAISVLTGFGPVLTGCGSDSSDSSGGPDKSPGADAASDTEAGARPSVEAGADAPQGRGDGALADARAEVVADAMNDGTGAGPDADASIDVTASDAPEEVHPDASAIDAQGDTGTADAASDTVALDADAGTDAGADVAADVDADVAADVAADAAMDAATDAGVEMDSSDAQGSCSAPGVDLIYLIDDSNHLLRFDPRQIGASSQGVQAVGDLSCPASDALPVLGGGPAFPDSIAVDRTGVAWVLYTSGEIFRVSTVDASCTATTYTPQQHGMDLFAMAFASDGPGADSETLYLAGGDPSSPGGKFATLVPSASSATVVGTLASVGEVAPLVTGTGNGELFELSFATASSSVRGMDKSNGQLVAPTLALPGLSSDAVAWAFSYWGGGFYVFLTTQDSQTLDLTSTVSRVDDTSGQDQVVVPNFDHIIYAAGVSTCAPVTVP